MGLLAELKRRNVIRMAGLYLVGAWLIVQVAGTLLPVFGAPGWVMKTLVGLLAVAFLPALVFAWVFELTPDGIKRDAEVPRDQSIAPQTAQRMNRTIVVVLLLALGYFGFDKFVLAPRREAVMVTTAEKKAVAAAASVVSEKSIAVLPFVNMSADKDQEYFSDGISEEILNGLAQVEGLKVAGRTSSFKFKGHNEDLRVIGEQLGVAHLLEGSIRKQGDSVRITAQLIKVADGFHLWSETYDRKLTDIFAIQDEISKAITEALSVQIMSGDVAPRAANIDPAAYDIYLRARQLLAKRRAESILQAATLFEAATIIDPKFDAAYSGKARALSLAWNFTGAAVGSAHPLQARQAAQQALALNPRNAEAHSALGYLEILQKWNWDEGLRETEQAIALAPNDAEIANFAGDAYRAVGDFQQATRWERRALELDPLLPINHVDLAWILQVQGRCQEAIAPGQKALELDPGLFGAMDASARAYLCLGDFAQASQLAERMAKATPGLASVPDLRARLAIKDGRPDDARKAIAELQDRARAGEMNNYIIAQLEAMLGDNDAAAQALSLAYAQRDPLFPFDDLWMLPEEWPDHPGIRATLDKPELKALFDMRRNYFKAQKMRGFK